MSGLDLANRVEINTYISIKSKDYLDHVALGEFDPDSQATGAVSVRGEAG